jgi:hypothetical protein
MKLILQSQLDQLLANGGATSAALAAGEEPLDHRPVVKLFTPDAGATWLLTEIDPEEPDIAFGLCDLGLGFPEIGSVCLSEIGSFRGALKLRVERDRFFQAAHPISVYARAADRAGSITTNPQALAAAAAAIETEQ